MLVSAAERANAETPRAAGEIRLKLACDRTAPATVRAALAEIPNIDAVRDDALLVASELVTNAVRHSGGDAGQTIDVRLERREDSLLISVLDPGVRGGVAEVELTDRPHGGWGLRVVADVARRWGRERLDGYRVWAELSL